MSMSYETPAAAACDDRVRSLARRMLSGAAAASLVAYRHGVGVDAVAHGLLDDGTLVVSAVPEHPLDAVAPGDPIDVRLDLVKQSPDPTVSLVAASAHLLGTLAWATGAEAMALRAAGRLPLMVEAMLTAPGARLGFVDVGRLVLHDLTGATVVPFDSLVDEEQPLDAYGAFAAVAGLDTATLKDLCWAVMVEAIPGIATSKGPLPGVCSHTADRVFCVDVAPTGLTLMLVGRHETLTVFARFERPAASDADLVAQVARLVERADDHRGAAA